jgi:20S proteasome subunit beta 2
MSVLPSEAVDKEYPSRAYGGFDSSNVYRNVQLSSSFKNLPKPMKTGTTICGVVYDGGVVLGADTRATGQLVVDKNCQKIHYIAPNIYCCGAGTAADCKMTARSTSSQLELLRLNTGASKSRVITAVTLIKRDLFQHQGQLECALILGGVDSSGSYLYSVAPHGSIDSLSFATQGSGSLAAMSVLESRYRDGLSEAEAVDICSDAILAGIFNDLGSGSNVDICVIRRNDTSYIRGFKTPNQLAPLKAKVRLPGPAFNFPVGSTKFIRERVEVFDKPEAAKDAMEVEGQ